jgi:hypothetical protein
MATDYRASTFLPAAFIGEDCMNLLRTAVLDITALVATCHALKLSPADGDLLLQRKLRNRMRRDIKRGTVAYIDTLARTRRGVVDDALLCTCRVAVEQQMPHALAHQDSLARIMAREAGSLDGLVAARQDLWRLAHMAIYLSGGMATLRGSTADAQLADALARHLRRRFREPSIAYQRAALRTSVCTVSDAMSLLWCQK